MPRRLPAPTRLAVRTNAPEKSPRHTATFSRILQGRRRQSGGLFLRLSRVFSSPFHGVKKIPVALRASALPLPTFSLCSGKLENVPRTVCRKQRVFSCLILPSAPCRKQKRKSSCGLHVVFFLSPRLAAESLLPSLPFSLRPSPLPPAFPWPFLFLLPAR